MLLHSSSFTESDVSHSPGTSNPSTYGEGLHHAHPMHHRYHTHPGGVAQLDEKDSWFTSDFNMFCSSERVSQLYILFLMCFVSLMIVFCITSPVRAPLTYFLGSITSNANDSPTFASPAVATTAAAGTNSTAVAVSFGLTMFRICAGGGSTGTDAKCNSFTYSSSDVNASHTFQGSMYAAEVCLWGGAFCCLCILGLGIKRLLGYDIQQKIILFFLGWCVVCLLAAQCAFYGFAFSDLESIVSSGSSDTWTGSQTTVAGGTILLFMAEVSIALAMIVEFLLDNDLGNTGWLTENPHKNHEGAV